MNWAEEVYPLEGMWAPWQARQNLREKFNRYLSYNRSHHFIHAGEVVIDDSSLLDLCQHYRLEYRGSARNIAQSWDESTERLGDGGPTFDKLIESGWIHFDGGRWMMQRVPIGTVACISYPSPSTESLLSTLNKVHLVAKTDEPPQNIKFLAEKISADDWLERYIPAKNPERLASRLWELLCPKPRLANTGMTDTVQIASLVGSNETKTSALADEEASDAAFLEWATWCEVLGIPARWNRTWGPTEMHYCRMAAQRVLCRQTLWGNWDNDVQRYNDVLTQTYAIPENQLRYSIDMCVMPPQTLVSQVDWLARPNVESLMMARHGTSHVSFAFGLLCSELERTDFGSDTTELAATVLSFAANHPMALQHLLLRVKAAPVLLVDLLLRGHFACLATRLVIEWQGKLERSNDRDLHREAQLKAFAGQDCLSILAYHLEKNTLKLDECTSLITWCYASSTDGRKAVTDSRGLIGRQILGMLAKGKKELHSEVLAHLVGQMAYQDNIPRACFSAALDGLICLSSTQSALTRPIVDLYSKFGRDMNLDWTDASSLSAEQTARLVASAMEQEPPVRDALFVPFDSLKLLRETTDDERPSLAFSIARTLRLHLRMLARAITGWSSGDIPTELFKAFQTLISRSVIDHTEKGRVAALTDRYSPRLLFTRENSSPANDLATAWRRLASAQQEAMLQALVQSDDPVLLAELCQQLPAAAKSFIQDRLRQLSPTEASQILGWPEMQHRIASLLSVGEYGLAREFLDQVQQNLVNAPQEFRLGFFDLELQLLLKEKNWTVLDDMAIPSSLNEFSTRTAQDQLQFFKATSQLLRTDGNLSVARSVLQRLASRPGAAFAYKENAFAVAIQQLMGPTLRPLTDAEKVTGESLLAEINASFAVDEKKASNYLFGNRALLLLALQRPKDAFVSISERRKTARSSNLEIAAALALYEMGDKIQALALLDAALTEFGPDERLVAVQNDLQAGVATSSIASASVAVDLITTIRAALQQLTELPPDQLGDLLGPPDQGARGYLIRQVTRAVGSLQQMAAMLRCRENTENDAKLENDLNTAVRVVLSASLSVHKWHVRDQSLGGVTASGNPGERDAVICSSDQEISIYEALVCSSVERTRLKGHFEKLLKYGFCDIYFHVTYAYLSPLKPLIDYVREMLEHEAPPGATYLNCEPLEPSNFPTSGYVATYQVDHRENVAVVFLIVDLKI